MPPRNDEKIYFAEKNKHLTSHYSWLVRKAASDKVDRREIKNITNKIYLPKVLQNKNLGGQENYTKMSIKKKILTIVLGLSLVAVIVPVGVSAALTSSQVQAIVSLLQSFGADATTIANVQTSLTGGTPATPVTPVGTGACTGVTFTRNLTVGSTGSDVKCMQSLLNSNGYTVATSGVGSPGMETTYFGPLTLVAVRSFQTAQGWTPANQAGPLTRAALNALIGGAPVTPGQPPVVVPTGAGLSVMLSSDNPASGTVVDGQAQAALAKLTFTNGDNTEVTVTQLKLKRTGISADASLTNVYLFNGATRLTDGASVSSTIISFNDSLGLFKVPAGGSVTITVTADVDGTAGETVGVQLVASTDVTTNASSVKGTYPISGNYMNIATGTLASVSFATSTTPAEASVDPQDSYAIFQNSVTVGTRAVDLKRISFRKTGSTSNTDLQNLKLYIDGVQVGSTMQLDANGYVTFDLTSAPKRLEAGTRVVKVLADIIGGSSLTFTMNLWNVADATFVDTQYGANVLIQANSTTFSKRSTGEQTVNSGTITITKMTDSPSGNTVDAATNVTLAKFQVKAAGESVKVETLKVSVVVNTAAVGYLRNGALYANGVQIGSTSNLYDTTNTSPYYTSFSLGSSLIVVPGSPVTLEVRADVYDNDGTNDVTTGTTIQVRIEGSASENNAIGQSSASTIDAPASDVNGNTLTVAQGGLTLSTYTAYTAQSVVAPLSAFKLAHFTLTASTTEAVNVTNINVTLDEVSSYTSNLYVVYGTQTTTVKPTVSASNDWAINYSLPAGTTIDVMVYGDVSSDASGATQTLTSLISGTTASSAVSADSAAATSAALTYTSGAFATATVTPPDNQIVAGNQSVVSGTFKFTSSYEAYTISELRFTANSNSAAIVSASLKDGATVLATVPYDNVNSYFNFTGLNVAIPASTSKSLTLVWNLSIPSYAASTSDVDTKAAMTYVKYSDPNGTVSTDANTRTANSTIVYKSIPTLALVDLTNSALVNAGAQDLYKFTIAAPTQGPVAIKQFKIALAWSDGGGAGDSLELESIKLLRNGTDITSSVTISDEDGSSVESTTGVTEGDSTIVVTWDGTTEDEVSEDGLVTYTIRGTPQGFNVVDASTASNTDTVSLDFTPDTAAQTATFNFINVDSPTVGSIVGLWSSATANASATDHNLIWSDQTSIAHSASTTAGTGDWSNSYLVTDIGAEAWTK